VNCLQFFLEISNFLATLLKLRFLPKSSPIFPHAILDVAAFQALDHPLGHSFQFQKPFFGYSFSFFFENSGHFVSEALFGFFFEAEFVANKPILEEDGVVFFFLVDICEVLIANFLFFECFLQNLAINKQTTFLNSLSGVLKTLLSTLSRFFDMADSLSVLSSMVWWVYTGVKSLSSSGIIDY